MKNSIILLGAILCLSLSCKEVEKEVEEVEKELEKIEVKIGEILDDCIKVDKRIYPQTTWIWAESWVSAFNEIYGDTISSSPELYFDNENLTRLKSKSNDATGVRLYYILRKETDKIPSLAMVNIANCKDKICDEGCVLVSWVDPETGARIKPEPPLYPPFISSSEFHHYVKNWKKADVKKDGYIQVTAYNYSWHTINALSSVENDMKGIRVKYGARTIELSEEKEYGVVVEDSVKGTPPITGNIVACNVLLGWNSSDKKSFKEALALVVDEGLDFAKPCPTFCGH